MARDEFRICERCGSRTRKREGVCTTCRKAEQEREDRLVRIERFIERLRKGWEEVGKSIFEE